MAAVLSFFIRVAPLIFALLVLGALFGFLRMGRARQETRSAAYGLEREIAQRHMRQAATTLVLVGILAFSELVLTAFLAPNIPALARLVTPTLNPLQTPSPTFPAELVQTLGAGTAAPSPTAASSGCIPGQIAITFPKAGDQIKGAITLQGTATIPNFGFYKYEFTLIGSENWAAILASRKPVQDGDLGNWDTTAIAPGDYQLRLVVTDNQGNELPACIIPVRILAK
jgi:hypothetical protein